MKEILPVYQNIVNQSMTGTSTIISSVSNIAYKDTVAVELDWTGTPNGNFYVEGSLSYKVGTGGEVLSAGTWTPIDAVDQNGNPPVASGAAGNILMNLQQLGFPYIRIRYLNSSGTGTLNGWISGKSLG